MDPRLMSDNEKRALYLEMVAEGKGPITCARAIGATHAAMKAIIAVDPEFRDAVEDAKAEAVERVANRAWEMAQMGNKDYALPILQSRKPEDFLPVKDMTLRLGKAEEDIDVGTLHQRLAAQAPKELLSGEDD